MNIGWEVDVDVGAGVYVEVGVGDDMVDVVVLAVVGDAVGLRRLAWTNTKACEGADS